MDIESLNPDLLDLDAFRYIAVIEKERPL